MFLNNRGSSFLNVVIAAGLLSVVAVMSLGVFDSQRESNHKLQKAMGCLPILSGLVDQTKLGAEFQNHHPLHFRLSQNNLNSYSDLNHSLISKIPGYIRNIPIGDPSKLISYTGVKDFNFVDFKGKLFSQKEYENSSLKSSEFESVQAQIARLPLLMNTWQFNDNYSTQLTAYYNSKDADYCNEMKAVIINSEAIDDFWKTKLLESLSRNLKPEQNFQLDLQISEIGRGGESHCSNQGVYENLPLNQLSQKYIDSLKTSKYLTNEDISRLTGNTSSGLKATYTLSYDDGGDRKACTVSATYLPGVDRKKLKLSPVEDCAYSDGGICIESAYLSLLKPGILCADMPEKMSFDIFLEANKQGSQFFCRLLYQAPLNTVESKNVFFENDTGVFLCDMAPAFFKNGSNPINYKVGEAYPKLQGASESILSGTPIEDPVDTLITAGPIMKNIKATNQTRLNVSSLSEGYYTIQIFAIDSSRNVSDMAMTKIKVERYDESCPKSNSLTCRIPRPFVWGDNNNRCAENGLDDKIKSFHILQDGESIEIESSQCLSGKSCSGTTRMLCTQGNIQTSSSSCF